MGLFGGRRKAPFRTFASTVTCTYTASHLHSRCHQCRASDSALGLFRVVKSNACAVGLLFKYLRARPVAMPSWLLTGFWPTSAPLPLVRSKLNPAMSAKHQVRLNGAYNDHCRLVGQRPTWSRSNSQRKIVAHSLEQALSKKWCSKELRNPSRCVSNHTPFR